MRCHHLSKNLILIIIFQLSCVCIAFANSIDKKKEIFDPLKIHAASYIVIDYDSGKILAQKNADTRLNPASLTKIMTSYIIGCELKKGKIHQDDIVIIGKDAWATGNPAFKGSSLMFLKPGDHVSVSQLRRGIILESGNDACVAMADYISGSQEEFVELMNDYSRKLGLKNTHFENVHGLDAVGQYSSAHDIAILSQALIHDVPDEYAIYGEKQFTFNNIKQINRNHLLWDKTLNVDGIKTGHTTGAGYNLVASATENNMRLISVIFGSSTEKNREIESKKLLRWSLNFFKTIKMFKANEAFIFQPVWFGKSQKVMLGIDKDLYLTIPRTFEKNINITYTLDNTELRAPLYKNKVLGKVSLQIDNVSIGNYPLLVLQDVPKGSVFKQILDFIKLFFYHTYKSIKLI